MKEEATIQRRFLTIEEVGAYLQLSKHTLYAMVSARRIPFTKVGRLTRFDRKAIDSWLDRNSVKALIGNASDRGRQTQEKGATAWG